MRVNVLVEGHVDEAVARKLIEVSGHDAGLAYGRKGWTYIRDRVVAFDRSCSTEALFTIVDFMDTKLACPPSVVRAWLPQRDSEKHLFRVVVREIESWIMADREGMANFLKVPISKLPHNPEGEVDPKQILINLARTSRSRAIREALVPGLNKSASEGPLYTSEMVRFVQESWDPAAARVIAPSLDKTLVRLAQIR
jgi:hypothetical protein